METLNGLKYKYTKIILNQEGMELSFLFSNFGITVEEHQYSEIYNINSICCYKSRILSLEFRIYSFGIHFSFTNVFHKNNVTFLFVL